MKITGSGIISAGQYEEEISVCGSGKINGNITCTDFKCSGALKATGDVIASGDVKISGQMKAENNLKGKDIKISGACTVNGNVMASGAVSVSGTLKTEGLIKASDIMISGTASAKTGMEAEQIRIEGRISCDGLINAEKVEISLEHVDNKIFGIGGSEINIYPCKAAVFVNKLPLLSKLVGNIGTLEVADTIEGDIVKVSSVKCPTVIGRVVEIGANCEIDCVKYIDSVDISPEARVGKTEKI